MLKILQCLGLSLILATPAWADDSKEQPNTLQDIPIDDLRLFVEVFDQIRHNYVTEVSDKELLEYAIKGMLGSLDPHSAYLDETDFSELQEMTTGEFGGLGLEITMENGFMKVIAPIDDTPAQRAGILPGDIIVKINDNIIKGLDLDDGIELMRGKKGSKIKLTIMRENQPKPIDMVLVRDLIRIKSVKSRILEKQWGYLRISQFQTETGKEAREQLQKMLDDSYNQLQGLIIDLRNNPGGILTSAVQVVDLFVDKGLIVYTEGRAEGSKENYSAHPETLMKGRPIVVLINGGSASASEIVAGALQDQKRAVIAGSTSFGKGSVQVILELPNNRGMKLTTARYYTPSGRSIQAQGIKPDIMIENASLTLNEDDTAFVKEADLSKHLENSSSPANKAEAGYDPLLDDYQLHEALNLLKAMNLAKTTVQ